MNVKVHEHTIEIQKSPVNELEVNVTKVQFEFDEALDNYVKKAFFSNDEASIEILLDNNECNIPNEVLTKKGTIRLGVIAYEVQNDTLIERYNPSPAFFYVSEGSMIEADNTEPITPTDKEQIEQMLTNINIDGEKEGRITTLTITYKDGTTKELTLEDGKSIEYRWEGTSLGIRQEGESEYTYVNLQGPQGQPGAINLLIVSQLPEIGVVGTLYFVEKQDSEEKDLYDEYMWVNNDWERVGEKQLVIDLTDYVKNTDYATSSKGGVVKTNVNGCFNVSDSGVPSSSVVVYNNYSQYLSNTAFISKGTLENVITGKGLVSNTDYASYETGGVIKTNSTYATNKTGSGYLNAQIKTYSQYTSGSDEMFISKGTLNNVLTATIGDISSVIDAINGESI